MVKDAEEHAEDDRRRREEIELRNHADSAHYQAEKLLHDLGFHQLRVRHHDKIARIEVERAEMPRLIEEEMSRTVTDGLRKIGYTYVTLDLLGFRSGSMNEGFIKKKKV